ncbi:hypothetical protein Scep_005919 [Stephania cephalantha]|uniref:Uncharacterized protein n=1 Tax=Stephania cephalantha TaxID=152367 RepID=A0AAP0KXU5_9MAGN
MNRVGRNGSNGSHEHRRGRSVTAIPTTTDDNKLLDLFSRSRTTHSLSVDESQQQAKLSVIGSVALSKSGMDNLLLSSSSLDLVDAGKHDYDWLLTPPETPLFPSSDATEHQPTVAARKPSFTSRSASTTKASRLSVGQSNSSYSSRPARSSSVTRPSISSTSYNTYSSSSNRSSVLNTSSASVSSIPRPSTPAARSTATSYSRPSTPAGSRSSVSSRPSTPTKSRPTPSSFSGEKTPTLQNSRPSTPSSRPQIPANLNSSSARTNSRPSMHSHRNAASSSPSTFTSRSVSGAQVLTNGRIPAAASRGSSPSPRTRPIPQVPVVLPDFPLETPPNLRTTLPERPVSAGRSRSNSGVTAKGSTADAPGLTNPPRRQSLSPVVTRGRLPELSTYTKGRLHGATDDNQRTPPSSESASRRLTKSLSSAEGNGFGRTISKKSLDVALRHVDIRHGSANGNTRSLSGTAIFPQSIRSATSKGQQARPLETSVAVNGNGAPPYLGGNMSTLENGNHKVRSQDGNACEDVKRLSAKVSDLDIYESSRYDALLLREDAKNTNWLHSIDDKSDEGSIFDNRFDILPEPFDPL